MIYNEEQLEKIWKYSEEFKIQQKKLEWMSFLKFINEMRSLKFENILEIGAYSGGCTISLSYFTENLISIDHGFPAAFKFDEIEKNCKYTYVGKNSHLIETFEETKQLLNGNKLDLLFIDGDHSFEGSLKDYEMYSQLLNLNALVVFHDIVDSHHHRIQNCNVAKTWKKITRENNNIMVYSEFIFDGNDQRCTFENAESAAWGGIGILLK